MEVISYDNTGKLVLFANQKRYTYYSVPMFQYKRARLLIQKNCIGSVFKLLANYSKRSLVSKEME